MTLLPLESDTAELWEAAKTLIVLKYLQEEAEEDTVEAHLETPRITEEVTMETVLAAATLAIMKAVIVQLLNLGKVDTVDIPMFRQPSTAQQTMEPEEADKKVVSLEDMVRQLEEEEPVDMAAPLEMDTVQVLEVVTVTELDMTVVLEAFMVAVSTKEAVTRPLGLHQQQEVTGTLEATVEVVLEVDTLPGSVAGTGLRLAVVKLVVVDKKTTEVATEELLEVKKVPLVADNTEADTVQEVAMEE